jgi:TIR domain/Protein of unknown function (DUF1566)
MWDVFISHASEDTEEVARPLADALRKAGVKVWYDEFSLQLGDGLRRSIDRGLADSRYGLVVLSPHFFAKEWPQRELDGLAVREASSGKIILPIWHRINRADVERFSPMLADKLAVSTSRGLDVVVAQILQVLRGEQEPGKGAAAVVGQGRRWRAPVLGGVGILVLAGLGYGIVSSQRHRKIEQGPAISRKPFASGPPAAATATETRRDPPLLLRSSPTALSGAQVDAMLVRRDFYEERRNASGKGIQHRYEPRAIGDAVVIVDPTTGLMWQKAGSDTMALSGAQRKLDALNSSKYAGYADWRFPTLEEALSLAEPAAYPDKYHYSPVFARSGTVIWTADPHPNGGAWVLYLMDSIAQPEPADYFNSLMAVRTVQRGDVQ